MAKILNESTYAQALSFAKEKHSGQHRLGGADYITHPIAVAEKVKKLGYGLEYRITALFHDLLEDTDATEEEILVLSNEHVLEAVKLLTKQEGYNMADYVNNIRKNKMAFVVKCADRLHNLECLHSTSPSFRKRYIEESIKWYGDFSDDIKSEINKLIENE